MPTTTIPLHIKVQEAQASAIVCPEQFQTQSPEYENCTDLRYYFLELTVIIGITRKHLKQDYLHYISVTEI